MRSSIEYDTLIDLTNAINGTGKFEDLIQIVLSDHSSNWKTASREQAAEFVLRLLEKLNDDSLGDYQ